MYAIHFYEDKINLLTRACREIPSVDEKMRIKGRNGKVINVLEVRENVYHVFLEFEKVVDKSKLIQKDIGKKRKR